MIVAIAYLMLQKNNKLVQLMSELYQADYQQLRIITKRQFVSDDWRVVDLNKLVGVCIYTENYFVL